MDECLPPELRGPLEEQQGVVSRTQLRVVGLSDAAVRRLVRRRVLSRVHRGVYVDHTGAPTWEQLAWAALLFYAPAALADESCLRAEGMRTGAADDPIHVAVDAKRRVDRVPGIIVHRLTGLG